MTNFTKIRSDGVKLTFCMRRYRQTEMKKLIGAFASYAKAPTITNHVCISFEIC